MYLLNAILLFHLFLLEIQCFELKATFFQAIDERCPSIPKLKKDKFVEKDLLGSGGFGSVHLMKYKVNHSETVTFALKKIYVKNDEAALWAAEEICKMYNMKHAPHVAKVFRAGFVEDKVGNPFALLAMDVYHADLRNTMKHIVLSPSKSSRYASSVFGTKSFKDGIKDPVGSLRWTSWLRYVLYQLALSVKETHDNGILHLDIKPDNFLVRPSHTSPDGILVPKVALSDFGLARSFNSIDERGPVGTLEFMAPEIFKPFRDEIHKKWRDASELIDRYRKGDNDVYESMMDIIGRAKRTIVHPTSKSDIYSLGVTFYFLATRTMPFKKRNGDYIVRIVSIYDYKGPECSQIDEKLCLLIRWMMFWTPQLRPSIEQVLDHEFFQDFNQ